MVRRRVSSRDALIQWSDVVVNGSTMPWRPRRHGASGDAQVEEYAEIVARHVERFFLLADNRRRYRELAKRIAWDMYSPAPGTRAYAECEEFSHRFNRWMIEHPLVVVSYE